ncbi:MAG TPA: queuosine salvage family protein [Phycisphaerae bacterium]|nr:queuosine salvage family protein [Phycisphaerae bacterium]
MNDKPTEVPTVAAILPSVERVVQRLQHVSIDEVAVARFARELNETPQLSGPEDDALLFRGPRESCANFCLLCDALNFCFWSDQGWELEFAGKLWTRTHAMIAGVLRAIDQDPNWLTADRWRDATMSDVETIFAGRGSIPFPDERLRIMNETGRVLCDRFDGQFAHAVDRTDQDASGIVEILARDFPSFRDAATHSGESVVFLKRAQICVADLHRTLTANGLSGLRGLESLTVFADYRLPQLFRHVGALVLNPQLAATVDQELEVANGSTEEVELRAVTIWIADQLVRELRRMGRSVDAWELDYTLWLKARSPEVRVPHHRTVSIFY